MLAGVCSASGASSASSASSSSSGAGGASGPVVLASDQQQPHALAIDVTHVYWTAAGSELYRVSKDGGQVATLASTLTDPVVSSGWAVAVDDEHVFWTSGSAQRVYRMAAGGGEVTVLFELMGFPSSITLDQYRVYVSTYSDTILSVPKFGGEVSTIATDAGLYAKGVALGGGYVYWRSGPTVLRAPEGAGRRSRSFRGRRRSTGSPCTAGSSTGPPR
jgi:hypothetical protein